jgi:hypothetical protein
MANINELQPQRGCVPGFSSETKVGATKDELQGCGKDDGPLTLYRALNELPPTPLSGGYRHVRCGYRPNTRNPKHAGILLCDICITKFGLK